MNAPMDNHPHARIHDTSQAVSSQAVSSQAVSHDVLVVGAGPAGLMLAVCLAQQGLKPMVIDSAPKGSHSRGRGDALQCRTIEVMRSIGIGAQLVEQGVKMFTRTFWDTTTSPPRCTSRSGFFSPRFDIDDCYSLGIRQGLVEDALEKKLAEVTGGRCQVERGWRFGDAIVVTASSTNSRDEEYVRATICSDYGERKTVFARYLVGCDGGKSSVRRMLRERHGIAFEGEAHDSQWAALDVLGVRTDFPDIRNLSIIHDTKSTVLIIPREPIEGKDCVRLYCQVDDTFGTVEEQQGGNTTSATLSDVVATIRETLAPFSIAFEAVHWLALYRIGQRLISSFDVQGRIFVAGDAAHLHSPKGGLGMNTSLLDAHNLAFKLALVERMGANRSILSTYNTERRLVAEELISMDRELINFFAQHRSSSNERLESLGRFQRQNEAYQSGASILYPPSLLVHSDCPDTRRLGALLSNPTTDGRPHGLVVGARLLPANVTRWRDCNPLPFLTTALAPCDGRFVVVACLGTTPPSAMGAVLATIGRSGGLRERLLRGTAGDQGSLHAQCEFPGPRYPKSSTLMHLVGVTMHHHLSLEFAQALGESDVVCDNLPADQRLTSSKAPSGSSKTIRRSTAKVARCGVRFSPDYFFCDDVHTISPHYGASSSHDNGAKPTLCHTLHEKWRVDPEQGAFVLVRPDGYVSLITQGLGASQWSEVENFFAKWLLV